MSLKDFNPEFGQLPDYTPLIVDPMPISVTHLGCYFNYIQYVKKNAVVA